MTLTNWCVRDKANGQLIAYNMTEAEARQVAAVTRSCEAVEVPHNQIPARPRTRPAPAVLTEEEMARILGQYQVQVKDGLCIIS